MLQNMCNELKRIYIYIGIVISKSFSNAAQGQLALLKNPKPPD